MRFCDIRDVCAFLAKHRPQITSYGCSSEVVTGDHGELLEVPAIKPTTLFRGQTKAYDTLRPSIYQKYPPLSTWQQSRTLRIDDDSLAMPHPHYSATLERDFYFSCTKAIDLIRDVAQRFPEYPEEKVDGHALCQHYGLPTHYLDFSECAWTAAFFASHKFCDGSFSPCSEGIGVLYVLELDQIPPGRLYEIGFQPLPRPSAQRGWLLRVTPEINLLAHPAVWEIHFQHSAAASKAIGERFREGKDLLPRDEIGKYIEKRLSERTVPRDAIEAYLIRVPEDYRPTLRASMERLFEGAIVVT